MNIMQGFDELSEIETSNIFFESASCSDVIEELSSSGQLQYNEDDWLLCSIAFLDDTFIAELYHIDDVGMVEVAEGRDLSDD